MIKWKKPRAWSDPDGGSSTIVLYDPRGRDDMVRDPEAVYVHTNMGWIAVSWEEDVTAQEAASNLADGYKLKEMSRERAIWACGFEGEEDKFED
jgi:hypothetical protein